MKFIPLLLLPVVWVNLPLNKKYGSVLSRFNIELRLKQTHWCSPLQSNHVIDLYKHIFVYLLICDQNHAVERIWPGVNNWVNYPIKTALLQMVDQEEINMDDSLVRYCVSNQAGQFCPIGFTRVVEAWNAHRIPGEINKHYKIITTGICTFQQQPQILYFTGKGVPNDLAGSGCPTKIQQELLPHSVEAADHYNQELGSSLSPHSTFGHDPFSIEQDKLTVESQFADKYPDISDFQQSTITLLLTTTWHHV